MPTPGSSDRALEEQAPLEARWVRDEAAAGLGAYVLELIEAVAQREENPVRLSEEQKDFLLVVYSKRRSEIVLVLSHTHHHHCLT